MSIPVALLNDTRIVQCDPRTGSLGGSFYENPHLQPYSPLPLRWCFDQLIRYEHATLIDVGASTGSFTLLSALHPDLTVHAFEPISLVKRVLQENIYLNNLTEKVIINQCAVSNYDGKGVMNVVIDDGGKGVSILGGQPAWHKKTEPVEVDVIKLDTYCQKNNITPHFLKVDCEGLDIRVLEGAEETIKRYHPFILAEYSQENADQYGLVCRDMITMVESWGYSWTCDGIDLYCVPIGWEELIK